MAETTSDTEPGLRFGGARSPGPACFPHPALERRELGVQWVRNRKACTDAANPTSLPQRRSALPAGEGH